MNTLSVKDSESTDRSHQKPATIVVGETGIVEGLDSPTADKLVPEKIDRVERLDRFVDPGKL